MEQKKIPFFKRLKNAITNFDEYQKFSQEKLGTAIKYFLKLMLIFSILISGFLTARMYKEIETIKTSFAEECPDFRIENNTLLIEGENKKYEKDIGYETLGLIVDSENTDLTEEQNGQYQRIIAFYKDKMVMKTMDTKTSMTYQDISKNQNINGLSKQQILDYANSNEMLVIYSIFFVVTIIFVFIAYSIQILLDIFLLSIIGLIMSKIAAVKLKYKEVFNMSIYALTLSIVLYLIYICVNISTGFTIKYFDLAYQIISYIYIVTAILMIKSDLIKQQIEVGKIIEEQKKVREEKKQEDNEEEKPKEDKKEKKEKKEKKDKEEKEPENPEGSQA
jgi:Sec-independent protein translocase protein TatA